MISNLAERVRKLFGGRRVAEQVLLRQPHAADVQRADSFGLDRPHHQLGGTTTDVDHEERPVAGFQLAGSSGKGQLPFLVAREQLWGDTDGGFGGLEELVAIRRIPRRGSGRHPQPLHPEAIHHAAVLAQHRTGALDRLGGESPRPADSLPEAGDPHQPLERLLAAVGDQQPGRVGATVNDGDRIAHRRGTSIRAATHRPTGSSPPARCQA